MILMSQILRLVDVEAGRTPELTDTLKIRRMARALETIPDGQTEARLFALLEMAAACVKELEAFPLQMAERLSTKAMTCSRYNAMVQEHVNCGQCEGLDRACQRLEDLGR